MESKITPELSPRNGKVPVAISYNTAPNENRSVRPSSSLARTCSGDIYATVPSVEPGLVRCCSSTVSVMVLTGAIVLDELLAFDTLASPKSRILAWPRLVTKMLARLDVAVNDAYGVGSVQSIGELDSKRQQGFNFQRPPRDAVLER